ncbi:MAG TPA: copper resistance CopC family protein, partial [Acidimicrobiales bacterium]|nr:copper resistance CopC family protein [Acidimicrobiales bacterium]
MRRITIIIAAFVMVLIGTAGPASAHADLRSTTPASGAVLKEPPSQVTMTFTERVEITASSVQVFDADGTRADGGGRAHHLAGRPAVVVLDLPDGLARGGYVVTWRVVSTDAHPIHGAFTFTVGTSPADVDGLARRLVDTGGTDAEVGFNYGVARALTFGGFLVLVGALAFGLLVGGAASVRRTQVAGAAACAVGTLAALPLHALAGAGLGLGRIGDAPVRAALLDGRYGQAAMVRLALLAV